MDARVEFFTAKVKLMGLLPSRRWMLASVVAQKLWAYQDDKLVAEYVCSTSEKPPSCQYGSNGTPLGLHKIEEKIGEGAPLGAIFEQRVNTGRVADAQDEKVYITSRILWLMGLEENKNLGYACGSHNRKIYIHGVSREETLGQPYSNGCINMKNADIAKLFDWAQEGDLILID